MLLIPLFLGLPLSTQPCPRQRVRSPLLVSQHGRAAVARAQAVLALTPRHLHACRVSASTCGARSAICSSIAIFAKSARRLCLSSPLSGVDASSSRTRAFTCSSSRRWQPAAHALLTPASLTAVAHAFAFSSGESC